MKKLNGHRVLPLLFMMAAVSMAAPAGESTKREIGRTTEKEISVILSTGFGKVNLAKGEPEKIITAEGHKKGDSGPAASFNYDIRNRIGYLELSLGEDEHADNKKGTFKFSGMDGGTWDLRFSPVIPISFDVELGVAKGNFNLSGLLVKDLKLSAGASDISLAFDTPNASTIDEVTIELGVGKFEGRNLGNANFKRFRFEGGVGSAMLDFCGTIQKEVDVDVQVGMGVCTIVVPGNVGARVFFEESLVSKISFGDSFRTNGENQFISDNYKRAVGRMNIRIDAGLGKVTVRQN